MRKNKKPSILASPTAQTIFAIALFALTVFASRGDQISAWERQLSLQIYMLPDFLFTFFYAVTQLGSVYMLAVLPAFYLVTKRYHVVIRLLLTGTLAYMIAGVAKDVFGRGRPHEFITDIISLDLIRGPGFPSGHMTLAAALALTFGHYVQTKHYWIPAAWIISVGLSRIYLGAHLLLDIIGGFALGWFAYALFRHVRLYPISSNQKNNRTRAKSKAIISKK